MSDSEIDTRSQSGSPDPATKVQKRKRAIVAPEEELEIDVTLPEPPSKKAKRKEKKLKNKPIEKPAENQVATVDAAPGERPASTKATVPEKSDAEQKRSEYGIWIGNLPWSATKDALRTFLFDHGNIDEESITRLHMPAPDERGPRTGPVKQHNRGFAYVDFKTKAELDKALALSEKLMTGRAVLIKDAKSFEGRPEKKKEGDGEADGTGKKGHGEKPPSQKIFVGNLGFDITKEDLQEHFGQAGEVEDVFMATFPDSGKCKGYAWVRFTTVEAAEAAVKGFVFKEPDVVEEEGDEKDSESDSEAEEPARAKKIRKEKKRKWFINRLQGRELRCEFAEDAQTRYKKRYGKAASDRPTNASFASRGAAAATESAHTPQNKAKMDPDQRQAFRRKKHQDARLVAPGKALAGAQRGKIGIVEGTGKKIAFT